MVDNRSPEQQLIYWWMAGIDRDWWIETPVHGVVKLVMMQGARGFNTLKKIRVTTPVISTPNGLRTQDDLTQLIQKGLQQWEKKYASLS